MTRLFTTITLGRTGTTAGAAARSGFSGHPGPAWDWPSCPRSRSRIMNTAFAAKRSRPRTDQPARRQALCRHLVAGRAHPNFRLAGAGRDRRRRTSRDRASSRAIRRLQASVHDLLSMRGSTWRITRYDDGVYLHGTLEVARCLRGGSGEIRPFVELQAGVRPWPAPGSTSPSARWGKTPCLVRDPTPAADLRAVPSADGPGRGWFVLMARHGYVTALCSCPEPGFEVEQAATGRAPALNTAFRLQKHLYGVDVGCPRNSSGQTRAQTVGSSASTSVLTSCSDRESHAIQSESPWYIPGKHSRFNGWHENMMMAGQWVRAFGGVRDFIGRNPV